MSRTGQLGRPLAVALAATLVVGLTACESAALGATPSGVPTTSSTSSGPSERSAPPAPATSGVTAAPSSEKPAELVLGPALAALGGLAVKGRAPKTGYDRDLFGQAWADVDRNGCDTRNDVLRRDLTAFVLKAGTHGCLVLQGTLRDPYTARTIPFVRGQKTSIAVQIDHVVALSDAWQKGAQRWSADKRKRFANDPLNLLAVDGPANARKGDGDAATWLPPAKGYRCQYVARQVAVKKAYGVWVTSAERAAIARVLATCQSQPLPTAGAIALGGGPERAVASPSRTAPDSGSELASRIGSPSTYYENCTAVRAADADPIRVGDPGYDRHLDRDGDGIACE